MSTDSLTSEIRCIVLAACFVLVGCEDNPSDTVHDQCLRAELFQQCLKALPAGQSTYNDWDDVVSECSSVAYYQSLRPRMAVNPSCKVEL